MGKYIDVYQNKIDFIDIHLKPTVDAGGFLFNAVNSKPATCIRGLIDSNLY